MGRTGNTATECRGYRGSWRCSRLTLLRRSANTATERRGYRSPVVASLCRGGTQSTITRERTATRDPILMPKMAHTGEDHGHITLIGSGDNFGVANRPARLNGTSSAGVGRGDEAIGEGKESIARHRAAL
jgi:hypothetical protein